MFSSKILWIVATCVLFTSGQRSVSSCRRYMCLLEPMSIVGKEPYIFHPHLVDPDLCTHILLFSMDLDGNKINVKHWNIDGLDKYQEELKKLKLKKPKLKILLTVAGLLPNSPTFSKMAATAASRRDFIDSLIPFLRDQGFDGVDLEWIYPTLYGGVMSDKGAFADLIKEMSEAFDVESSGDDKRKLILSAWGPNNYRLVDRGYDVEAFARYLDLFNIHSYAYHGYIKKPIGHMMPLESYDGKNVKDSVNYWVERGMPKPKINIAFLATGRRVYTNSSSDLKIGESINLGLAPNSNSRAQGYLTYYQICSLIKEGGKVHWDSFAHSPYHTQDNYFLSYENQESIKDKVQFLRKNKYGGVVFRGLLDDDYLGISCGNETYPLLRTLKKECTVRMY